ncbi:MAG: ABC transporter permease subunit, partial [Clostridia bacterium]|nr:ABC transporter permease subunit [Clostridia bacterium]
MQTIIEQFPIVVGSLNEGFLQTIKLFLFTLVGALPLGLLISFCSKSSFSPLRLLTRFVIWIVRGSPLMLQLLIIFYGPGLMGFPIWGGDQSGRFWASAVAFIINYACYFSEIFRSGMEGVPKGQQEAGQVLGMTKPQ